MRKQSKHVNSFRINQKLSFVTYVVGTVCVVREHRLCGTQETQAPQRETDSEPAHTSPIHRPSSRQLRVTHCVWMSTCCLRSCLRMNNLSQ